MEKMTLINNTSNMTYKELKRIGIEFKNKRIVISSKYQSITYHKKMWYLKYSTFVLTRLHKLTMINYLLNHYQKFQDDNLLDQAFAYFYLWYEDNFPKSSCKLCYDNEVVSVRLLNILDLLILAKNLDLCILDEVFIKVITHHLKLIAESDISYKRIIYIIQNISLLIGADIYNRIFITNGFNHYIDKAMTNINEGLNYFIQDGQYLGNSLEKAYQLFIKLYYLYRFLENEKYKIFKEQLKFKLDELYRFIYENMYPGGLYANSYINISPQELLKYPNELSEHFLYLYTRGKEGKKILSLTTFYEKRNMLIINSSNCISDKNYYKLVFQNSFLSEVNKLHDNLHFTLYYQDQFIFITNKQKELLNNCHNFNTLSVDFHEYLIDASQKPYVAITNVAFLEAFTYVSSVHTLYEKVICKRNIIAFPDTILLIDEFISKDYHDFEISFNLHPQLSLLLNKDCIECSIDDNLLLILKNLYFSSPIILKLDDKVINRIFIHSKGRTEVIINQIIFNKENSLKLIDVNEERITFSYENETLYIKKGDYYNDLYVNDFLVSQSISSNLNLEKEVNKILF